MTASLSDSGMVFKDRILYMVNIRKLRRGILPGVLAGIDACWWKPGIHGFSAASGDRYIGPTGNSEETAEKDTPYPESPIFGTRQMQMSRHFLNGQMAQKIAETQSDREHDRRMPAIGWRALLEL